jgi:hypothetical protein
MSKKSADTETTAAESAGSESDDETPTVPEEVVRAAEQVNRGESVSKSELMAALDTTSDE